MGELVPVQRARGRCLVRVLPVMAAGWASRVERYRRQAGRWTRRDEHALAARAWRRVLAVCPGDTSARFGLAVACHAAGDLHEAVVTYGSLLEREPGHAQAWFNLGFCWKRLGAADLARSAWERGLALAGDRGDIWEVLGLLELEQGAAARARRALARAVALRPGEDAPLEWLAEACRRSGMALAARRAEDQRSSRQARTM